jgi:hypothetical protein
MVELQPTRAAAAREVRGDHDQELLLLARREVHGGS